jgi:hypothetical protein
MSTVGLLEKLPDLRLADSRKKLGDLKKNLAMPTSGNFSFCT